MMYRFLHKSVASIALFAMLFSIVPPAFAAETQIQGSFQVAGLFDRLKNFFGAQQGGMMGSGGGGGGGSMGGGQQGGGGQQQGGQQQGGQ